MRVSSIPVLAMASTVTSRQMCQVLDGDLTSNEAHMMSQRAGVNTFDQPVESRFIDHQQRLVLGVL